MRKIHSAAFKLKVVLESYRPDLTIAQVSSQYKVHSTQIHQWKRKFKEDGPNIFSHKKDPKISEMREEKDDLYRQIGQLTVENDWLKKKSELLAS